MKARYPSPLPCASREERNAIAAEVRELAEQRIAEHRERVKRELLIESNRRPQRHVRCVETDETYDTAREAAKAVGVLPSRIYRSIKYKKPTKGKTWEWV